MRRTSRAISAAAGALALALTASGLANADTLTALGDSLNATNNVTVTSCQGPTTSNGLATIKRQGNTNFADGASVSVSSAPGAGTPSGISTGGGGTVVLPNPWRSNSPDQSKEISVRIGGNTPDGTYTINVSASGARSGGGTLTLTTSYLVKVDCGTRDTTPPVLSLPADVVAEATGQSGAVVAYTATANDAVDGVRPVTCTPASGSTFAIVTTTVSCSASDASGNTSTGTFRITVRDTTAPQLTLPAPLSAEATSADGAQVTFTASATDVVDGAGTVSCTPASGSTFPVGLTTVQCSASDTRGNVGRGSFTVRVGDTTAPALSLPADVVAEATGPSGAAVTYTATARDDVDRAPVVSCEPSSGSTFVLGATSVGCSATDAHGNRSTGSFTVTVRDTTAPDLAGVPATQELEATSGAGARLGAFAVSAADLVDGDVPAVCTADGGRVAAATLFPLGATTVTCTASDAEGNLASASFAVTVVDTTAPELRLPQSTVTEEATGPSGAAVSFAVSAADLVDGDTDVVCTEDGATVASGDVLGLGMHVLTCSSTDRAGNRSNEQSFVVEVVDTSAPVLTVPADITAEATGSAGAAVTYSATASDLVDGDVTVSCDPANGATFALGRSTVTCAASDAAGNRSVDSFQVDVVDTTPPVLDLPSATVTREATGSSGAAVSYSARASDLVDGATQVVCTDDGAPVASGDMFSLGRHVLACSSIDSAGNSSGEHSFVVEVVDTAGPVLALPTRIIAEATGPQGAVVTYAVSARDTVDGAVTIGCDTASGATFALGRTSVTCEASDSTGNRSVDSFDVEVADTTGPVITWAPKSVYELRESGPRCTAVDAVAGEVACWVDGFDSASKTSARTMTAHASDGLNSTTASAAYAVNGWPFGGFKRPVDGGGVLNRAKAGSAIPVKFDLGGDRGLAIFSAGGPASGTIACDSSAIVDTVEETVTAGSSTLSYDAASGQYHYVWKTDSKWAGSCRQLVLTLADGSRHTANFQLTK